VAAGGRCGRQAHRTRRLKGAWGEG
jgi:hypothetical protein